MNTCKSNTEKVWVDLGAPRLKKKNTRVRFNPSLKFDFKVTLMESLLINRDHPPLNKNRHSLPLELFDN